MIERSKQVRGLNRAVCVAVFAFFATAPAISMDLGEVARNMRKASEISRHGKSIYDRVQSITRASSEKRNDTLPSDGKRVVFYSASWCGYCNKARDYMNSNNVDYVEYDIENSAKGRADYEALNARGVPILLIGDQRMSGWSESRFRRHYADFKASPTESKGGAAQPVVAASSVEAGTVLAAKIDNVAVFASSSRDSQVVTRLKKGEEVVATEGAVGELVSVETSSGSGWVDSRLLQAQQDQ